MQLRAAVNFSYRGGSFKAGEEYAVADKETAEFLLKSGYVEEVEKTTAKKGSK